MSDSLWPHGLQHARLPCPSVSPRVCSNSCPLSWWRHPTISFSVTTFSSCPRSFSMSWLFVSGGQIIGASASASVLPVNIQGWFPSGSTGLISLLSKGLSRGFSSSTVWNHQFFGTQPSLWSPLRSSKDFNSQNKGGHSSALNFHYVLGTCDYPVNLNYSLLDFLHLSI